MKKTLLFTLLLISNIGFAQITLEHDYMTYGVYLIKTDTNTYYYSSYNSPASNTITIYDLSHSVFKTLTIPVPAGYTMSQYHYLSTTLFNTNASDFEYIAVFLNTTTFQVDAQIIDENGTILLDMGNTSSLQVFNLGSNGTKLISTIFTPIQSKVYSLPGKYIPSGIAKMSNDNVASFAYPNPSSKMITLPYIIPNGSTTGELIIINNVGQSIKSYRVDRQFENILFDGSQYPSGQYYYYLRTDNYQSKANNFIISK